MADEKTPDEKTSGSADDLREQKVTDLRDKARELDLTGTSSMNKEELVGAVSGAMEGSGGSGSAGSGGIRTGPGTSRSLQYSQEITSTDEDPERPGRSLVTTSHEVIQQWADSRGARPATVDGTEHGDHLGVLRFVFGDDSGQRLREVSWDEWFATFDTRDLNFIYQEERSDGQPSNFFRLESPHREDA